MTAILSPARRHPGSVSLGFGLFLVFLLALPLSFLGNLRSQALRERHAAQRLRELGGDMNDPSLQYNFRFALPENCWPITTYHSKWDTTWGGEFKSSPVNDEVTQLLPELPNLRILCLNGDRQPGAGFAPLSRLTQLKYLTLSCDVTDEDVLCFVSQRQLDKLILNEQRVSDACLVVATRSPNISHIELADTAIRNAT